MKKLGIISIVILMILGIILIPKIIKNEGDRQVKFKSIEVSEAPEKIQELIPRYLSEERALACKIDNSIYIILTRGEKSTAGYSAGLERIEQVKNDKNYNLVVHAKYTDPKPDEMVAQVITYPVVVVKTELEGLPDKIKLEVDYEE
ncbi:hypothetical protein Curi_c20730 [Gottschalkia acidurici 9a]|uniref:PrcB C-terminal domain-containing protein n=1 Tax=Gottschalkia acidurici (strain ATCC 7906 / DSM 604 / BCRC 14475 / CIP 104303 / KCTC 5404 / NCIMB 10678 / 9a) TaxID=1128398 RepID=K0B1T4_GOTA9|nr:protease complex subunit PrcB family protein [Gottschalkia acidurici]AFS79077.1 hypothetical protein Curi_c20730 [Gottschalkia acidurici 9a]